jgi:hypothetical protein
MIRYPFKTAISLILIGLLSSCSLPREYQFQIENATAYEIDTFRIGQKKDSTFVSIASDSTSPVIHYQFNGTLFNFAEPMIYLTVGSCYDSIQRYENHTSTGKLISVPNLYKRKVNLLRITTDSLPPTEGFDYERIKTSH